jgi:hypothetical protein
MEELNKIDRGRSRTGRVALLLLLVLFMLVTILSSPGITVTLDEPLHYHYGLFVLEGKTDRIDDSSMPVSALNALPAHVAAVLPNGILKDMLEHFFLARLITIITSAVFASLVFRWSEELYGLVPAVFSTALYVLDPNIIANSQLVTTDVFATGMITFSMYRLWKFTNSRKSSDGLICAAAIGLSQLVKYTAVVLLPLCLGTLLIHDWPYLLSTVRGSGTRVITRYAGSLIVYILTTLVFITLILNVGFLFNRTFTRVRDYRFRSELLRSFQEQMPALGLIPVPIPYPYLEGLDWMRETEQTGNRYGNVYLLGHLSKPQGFPGYYFVASALKVPISTQLIIIGSVAAFFIDRRRRRNLLRDEIFMLLPVALLTVYFNFFFNAQTGMRYYLVVFPLLYVFAGSLFVGWRRFTALAKAASVILMIYLAVSVLAYFPYFTPYFNEFVWDKTQTYRYLSDTNLEWGQSQEDLNRYLVEYPDATYNPAHVQPGRLVIGGSDLVGILEKPSRYAWLRENFRPVDTIAYCYFVYVISPEEVSELCTRTNYCK